MPRQARTGGPTSDLTRVIGIGAQTATRLRAAGIDTVDQLASTPVEQVVTACGGLTTAGRAASWIEQAAALASPPGIDAVEAAAPADTPSPQRTPPSPPRRTFTVEVRLEGDPARPVTTHAVHLETQQAEGWPAWDRARLLDFLEQRIGVANAHAQPALPEESTAPPDVAATEPAASVAIHRYGLLKTAATVRQSSTAAVRLHLEPAELDLPGRGSAIAKVDLLARPLGTGREQVLARHMIDLSSGQAVDVHLPAPLPNYDAPFALSAIVRILVEQPSEPPRADLGDAVLDIVASNVAD
jgi:hypothetical protein